MASSPRISETHPALSGERVAFVDARSQRIVLAGLHGRSRHVIRVGRPSDPGLATASVEGLDLDGTRLAVVWARQSEQCLDVGDEGDDKEGYPWVTEVWIAHGAKRKRLDRDCGTDESFLASPSLLSGSVAYLHAGAPSAVLRHRTFGAAPRPDVPLPGATTVVCDDDPRTAFVRSVPGTVDRWQIVLRSAAR